MSAVTEKAEFSFDCCRNSQTVIFADLNYLYSQKQNEIYNDSQQSEQYNIAVLLSVAVNL